LYRCCAVANCCRAIGSNSFNYERNRSFTVVGEWSFPISGISIVIVGGGRDRTNSKGARPREVCMRELYPKVRAAVYSFHSFGHPARYPRKALRIVLLNQSTFPFLWGWYALENTFSIPSSRHTARKNLATNCGPLSVRTCLGCTYVNTQCSQNALATIYAVVLLRGTVLVSFQNRSVMTKRNWFPCVVFGSGPSRSIET
jgi:hypothetical protein